MTKLDTQNEKRSFFSTLWLWLSKPHSSVVEIGEQRRAQLLAGLSLIITFTLGLGSIVRLITTPEEIGDLQTVILIGLAILSFLTYILSRTRYHQAGSILLVTIFSVVSAVDVIQTRSVGGAIFFLVPAFALSSALLSVVQISILVLVNMLFLDNSQGLPPGGPL